MALSTWIELRAGAAPCSVCATVDDFGELVGTLKDEKDQLLPGRWARFMRIVNASLIVGYDLTDWYATGHKNVEYRCEEHAPAAAGAAGPCLHVSHCKNAA